MGRESYTPGARFLVLPVVLVLLGSRAALAWDAAADGLAQRLDSRLRSVERTLRSSPGHYGLVHDVEEADLVRATAQVSFRRDGRAFVLGVGDVVELHGGGILALLFSHWRPGSAPATAETRFLFRPNGRTLSLGALYEGHKRQIFLPASPPPREGGAAAASRAADAARLPRMRFFAAEPDVADVERDAFHLLRLLVAREPDFAATWTNHLGQRLSVDLLLRGAWDHYLASRGPELEREDHSNLHLVEVLLAYRGGVVARGGRAQDLDPESIRARFFAVELARDGADDEAVAHYAESLGFLAAEPGLCWDEGRRGRVRAWLARVDARFEDFRASDPRELTHLLRGLRMLRDHAARPTGSEGCEAAGGSR